MVVNKLNSLITSQSEKTAWMYPSSTSSASDSELSESEFSSKNPSILHVLKHRESRPRHINRSPKASRDRRNLLSSYISRRVPALLKEREYKTDGYDKVFASVWWTDEEVIIGTKCNKLAVINVVTGKKIEIPSVVPAGTVASTDPIHCSGIHALAINPSRTLLAVGAGKPTEFIQIFKLPSFEPVAVLRAHSDMVFAVSFLSDDTLISGSRDTSVRLWKISDETKFSEISLETGNSMTAHHPSISRNDHRGKVRDLKYDSSLKQAMTLSSDGFVKLWDTNTLDVITTLPLIHTQETVCLGVDLDHHLYAVGSQSHVSILDPRCSSIVHSFTSCDDSWGVRSMSVDGGILTVGGGLGRISFYDLIAQKYLDWNPKLASPHSTNSTFVKSESEVKYLQSGTGWLCRDEMYINHFQGARIHNAIYTMSYDQSGSRLFTAGGPLQLALQGSYAALW